MQKIELSKLRENLFILFDSSNSDNVISKIAFIAYKFFDIDPSWIIDKKIIGLNPKIEKIDQNAKASWLSQTALLLKCIYDYKDRPELLPKIILLISIALRVESALLKNETVIVRDRLLIINFIIKHFSSDIFDLNTLDSKRKKLRKLIKSFLKRNLPINLIYGQASFFKWSSKSQQLNLVAGINGVDTESLIKEACESLFEGLGKNDRDEVARIAITDALMEKVQL